MRIVIDVTQLAGWQGKLTGIPRVMYELSSRYADLDDKTIFIGWDAGRQVFWELSFSEIKDKRNSAATATTEQLKLSTIKRSLRHFYDASPDFIKTAARRMKALINSVPLVDEAQAPGFSFKKGDKLIVFWGEWADANYRSRLVDAVKVDHVSLYQMVHDMLPLVTPQYSAHSTEGLNNYATEIYPLCHKLISVSKHTKKDVSDWLTDHNLKTPPIGVIRLGDNFEIAALRQPDHTFFASNQPYIVCVGTIETRKNHTLLYYVYKLAKARNITLPPLVIVGRRGWLTENIYDLMTNDPETKDLFVFLHDASDEELSWIYEHSMFSVYPSHYEGWGLPVAESIAHGIPCISSNTSSMTEIAGDLISYFSPVSTDECLQAIVDLLDDNNLQRAEQKISAYQPTSWDETFTQIQGMIGDKND